MHQRNKYQGFYNFDELILKVPELKKFILLNKFNNESTIDFSDPMAVLLLNKALLFSHYQISFWDIPKDNLCPPIPGRADYIHYIADCINEIKFNSNIKMLDIGVGANCIYPLIAHLEYGWKVVGTDIDPLSIKSANEILLKNKLDNFIEIRNQVDKKAIFEGILKQDDYFDIVVSNPPFYKSKEEASTASFRKNKNLKLKNKLNFGGVSNELWCEGGELEFIVKMIKEGHKFKNQFKWLSSLVSSKDNLSSIYGELKRIKVREVKTIEMGQGQKKSRLVAWKYDE